MHDVQSPFLTGSTHSSPDGATELAYTAPETSPETISSEHEDAGFDEFERPGVWLGEIVGTENQPDLEPQRSRSEQADPGIILDIETEALLGDLWDSAKTMWERALVGAAVAKGERRESNLTNLVFFRRHPERTGRPLSPDEPGFHGLAAEWKAIRDSIVQPALARSTSAPPHPTPAVKQANSSLRSSVPTFADLWANHPSNKNERNPCQTNGKKNYENQCVIRLGVSLTSSGISLENYPGAFCWHGHGKQHPLRVEGHSGRREMKEWLNSDDASFVGQAEISRRHAEGTQRTHADYAGRQGIVVFRNFWARLGQSSYRGDHVDLWDGTRIAGGDNDYFERSEEIWFWDMPLPRVLLR